MITGQEMGQLWVLFSHPEMIHCLILFMGFPGGSVVKNSVCQCRRRGFDPWSRQSPGGGNGNPLHCSCLGNPMDRGAWQGCSPWSHKELDMTSRINNKLSDAGKVLFRFSASKSLILESTDASRGWKAYIPHLPFWNGFS